MFLSKGRWAFIWRRGVVNSLIQWNALFLLFFLVLTLGQMGVTWAPVL